MSKSPTTIDPADWLQNPHAGDILASEYMEPLGLSAATLASAIGMGEPRLCRMIDGKEPVDAGLDLRLGRYFGLSEGFFLRLQNAYDLQEAWRAQGDAIEQVSRRAA